MTRTLRFDHHWYTSRAFWVGAGLGCAGALAERDENINVVTDAIQSAVMDGLIFVALARAPRAIALAARSVMPSHTPRL